MRNADDMGYPPHNINFSDGLKGQLEYEKRRNAKLVAACKDALSECDEAPTQDSQWIVAIQRILRAAITENDVSKCEICGEPMPEGEAMFRYHGYSGKCPAPDAAITHGPPCGECHLRPGEVCDICGKRNADTP